MTQATAEPHQARLESAVITKAVLKAAFNLRITNKTLAKVLGLSEATISRMGSEKKVIDSNEKAFELAALFVRLYRSLDAIMGGDDEISAAWLKNKNTALNGCPLDMIQSVQGLISVIQYLDSRRAVV